MDSGVHLRWHGTAAYWDGCTSPVWVVGNATVWSLTEGYASLPSETVYYVCLCPQAESFTMHVSEVQYVGRCAHDCVENEATEGHTSMKLIFQWYGTHVLFAFRLGVEQ